MMRKDTEQAKRLLQKAAEQERCRGFYDPCTDADAGKEVF